MSAKYKLRVTGECKQNMKLCKRRGLPMDELWTVVGKLQYDCQKVNTSSASAHSLFNVLFETRIGQDLEIAG